MPRMSQLRLSALIQSYPSPSIYSGPPTFRPFNIALTHLSSGLIVVDFVSRLGVGWDFESQLFVLRRLRVSYNVSNVKLHDVPSIIQPTSSIFPRKKCFLDSFMFCSVLALFPSSISFFIHYILYLLLESLFASP